VLKCEKQGTSMGHQPKLQDVKMENGVKEGGCCDAPTTILKNYYSIKIYGINFFYHKIFLERTLIIT